MSRKFDDVDASHLNYAGWGAAILDRLDQIEEALDAGVYFEELNDRINQIEENILRRLEKHMADVNEILAAFRAAVDKEFLDDKAQNDLIALLQSNLAASQLSEAEARDLAEAARAGEADAKAQVDALLAEIQAATDRLGENDLPDVEAPVDPDEPVEEPVEPSEPVEEPVDEPEVPVEEPVDPELPEEPIEEPELPIEEEPVEEPTEPVIDEPVEEPAPVEEPEVPVEEPVVDPTEPEVPTDPDTEPEPGETEPEGPAPTPTPDNPFAI